MWDYLSVLDKHPEWMTDALSVEYVEDRRQGEGTRIRVATKVGPFRTVDRMRFTEWREPEEMAVEHVGLFTGEGRFTLTAIDRSTTRFTWEETIRFPWYLGGPLGALVARPILARVWKGNLERLRLHFTDR